MININPNKPFTHTFSSMSTKCSLQIYAGNTYEAEKACKKVEENTFYLEKKYNFYDPDSYLNKIINNRKKAKIKIDEQSSKVLQTVKNLSKKVEHNFDISVGTYKHCYQLKDKKELFTCIQTLLPKSGDESWSINKRFLEFKHPETKLDLGGVIKEYAVDEAVSILHKCGISSAIINFGGDLYALGEKPNGTHFTIGVKNPKNPKENLLSIQVKNQALTTSAHYERSYSIEDETFSHILSKKQKPAELLSATVVSESVLTSGIYSTSFMIDTNLQIPQDLKVVLIDKDLKLHQNILY